MGQWRLASRVSWLLAVAVVCGGIYVLVAGMMRSGHTSLGAVGQNTTSASTPGDVPNSVLQKITARISAVPGVAEVFVNPSASGGYDVSGTVGVDAGATQSEVNQAVAGFLDGAYSSHLNIKDVQVYVLREGNIIAGAGLGADVYKQLTSTTGVSDFSILSALKGSQNNVAGVNDKWYQSQVASSS